MPSAEDELDQVVESMLAGDETSFRLVYRAVHPPLLRYLSLDPPMDRGG